MVRYKRKKNENAERERGRERGKLSDKKEDRDVSPSHSSGGLLRAQGGEKEAERNTGSKEVYHGRHAKRMISLYLEGEGRKTKAGYL